MNCSIRITLCLVAFLVPLQAAPSDKSGVKPSVISLPKGAGSIEGLGESFEPQLNTGGSTYGISVTLPPGRAGLQPAVRLAYNSNTGNGLGGIGWSLEFPTIKRQTDKGFPEYNSGDTFVFGGEELVPLTNGDWRCENESGFQRLRQIIGQDGVISAWEVTERTGLKHTFGKYRGQGGRWSVVDHPEKAGDAAMDRTYAWHLDTTTDLHGNRIEYEYDPGLGVLYPSRITWSHLGGAAQEVVFRYEERTDAFDDYRPTFASRLKKRLSRIEVSSQGMLVRAYAFGYEWLSGDLTSAEQAVQNGYVDLGVSVLKRVVQLDRSGNSDNYLPPLVFTYSGLNLAGAGLRTVTNSAGAGTALPDLDLADSNGRVQLADVNGDSRPDLFQAGLVGAGIMQKVCLNRGEETTGGVTRVRFDPERLVAVNSPVDLAIPNTILQDAKGRGLVDASNLTGSGASRELEIFRNRAQFDVVDDNKLGFTAANLETSILQNPPAYVTFSSVGTRQADINFDKKSDFLFLTSIGGQMKLLSYYQKRDGQWEDTENVLPAGFPVFANGFDDGTGQSNPCLQLADMNGDRMLDLVCLNPEFIGGGQLLHIKYWPLSGLGRYGAEVNVPSVSGDSFNIGSVDLKDVIVEDFTGDGLADIIVLDGNGTDTTLTLRVNVAGHGWSPPDTRSALPRYAPRAASNPTIFRLADVNSNGTTDLVFRNTAPQDTWEYLELLPYAKANLVTGIDNSLGKRTTIVYGNASEDEQAARATEPPHPWRTSCPIALQVVREIRSTCSLDLNGDGAVDSYVARFRYRDPYYDGLEREFRGFSYAQRTDYGDDFLAEDVTGLVGPSSGWDRSKSPTGQVSGPSLVTRFGFHTGAADLVDNDDYSTTPAAVQMVDEYNVVAGREEEVLKGRQLVEEKLDARVLHGTGAVEADFDAGCDRAAMAETFAGRGKLTPDAYVYTRAYQEWTVRRLYRPTHPVPFQVDNDSNGVPETTFIDNPIAPVPVGRFSSAGINVVTGSPLSVSFAFVGRVATEVHEANGVLASSLSYPARAAIPTLSTFEYDDYGNETRQRDYGVDGPGYDDERFTTTSYALGGNALGLWVIGQPDVISVTDEAGAFVSKKAHFYDGADFIGVSGQITDRALLKRVTDYDKPTHFVQSTRSGFDAYGNLTEMRDPMGNVRRIGWDAEFKTFPVNETIVVGNGSPDLTITAGYDTGFGVVTSSLDFNGNTTSYHYDSFARLVKIVKPGDTVAQPTLAFEYQPVDPVRGQAYLYSAAGDLSVVAIGTGNASRVITRQREQSGQAGEFITATFVDGCGKALAEIEEGETANTWIVKSATSYSLRQKPSAKWLPYQVGSVVLPQFSTLWPAGRPPFSDGVNPATTSSTLFQDSLGREIRSVLPPETWGGPQRTTATRLLPLESQLYDEEDLRAGSPHEGTPHIQYQDGLGRMIGVDEVVRVTDTGISGPLATWPTRYRYDLNDQLTRITDSQNNVKTLVYDGLKRLTDMSDPDRGSMTYLYDDASNLKETLDAKGQRIVMTYDGANRIKTEDYQDARNLPIDVEYFYDVAVTGLDLGRGITGTAAAVKGQLAYVQDLSGETHFSYDSRARLAWEVKRIPDPDTAALVSWQTGYAYDTFDRVTRVTYPDGDYVGHEYNDRALLDRLTGGPTGAIVSGLDFRPSGQLGEVRYGNGTRSRYAYDPRQRLTTLGTARTADSSKLIDFAYQFDGASNITRIDDGRDLTGQPGAVDRKNTQVFGYDSLYRLTSVVYPALVGGSGGRLDYRYDRIGNMLAQTSNLTHTEKGLPVTNLGEMESGGTLGRTNRTGRTPADPPGPHALTSISQPSTPNSQLRSYDYDANGNMKSIDGMACTWDFKDRLTTVEDATMLAVYTYDYTDRRIIKTVTPKSSPATINPQPSTPSTTSYINRYFEIRDYDQPVKYVWQGETRVARVTGQLNAGTRTQKLRLKPGWNLAALTVSGAEGQLAAAPALDAVIAWSSTAGGSGFIPIKGAVPLPALAAGTPVWLHATQAAILTVTGSSVATSTATPSLSAGGQFISNSTDAPWSLSTAFPTDAEVWDFLEGQGRWQKRLPIPNFFASDPAFDLLPGQSAFVRSASATALPLAAPSLQIRYYHQDHLGSSSVITDQSGQLVEEVTNYPFGHPRYEHRPLASAEAYGFTQKERDKESGLQYFEARYLASVSSRFLSIDPALIRLQSERRDSPQHLNSYAYSINNPLRIKDSNGETPQVLIGALIGAVTDVAAQLAEDALLGERDGKPYSFTESIKNLNVTSIVTSAALGALTGGMSAEKNVAKFAASVAKKQLLEAGKGLLEKTVIRAGEKSLQAIGVDKETTKKIAGGYKAIKLISDVSKINKGLDKSITHMDSRGMSDLNNTKDLLKLKAKLELSNKLGAAVEDQVKEADKVTEKMTESKSK